jgi:hypothetical protein
MDIQKILDDFAKSKFRYVGCVEGLHYSKTIAQYDLQGNLIRKYNSFHSLRKELGVPTIKIKECLKGKRTCAKGFIWKYA